jgi:hypothetical protein
MADAGMRMGSAPLQEALARIDSLEAELKILFAGDGIDMEAVRPSTTCSRKWRRLPMKASYDDIRALTPLAPQW